MNQKEAPYPESIRYVSVDALVTNRDFVTLVPRNGEDDLDAGESSGPIASIGLIRAPSAPRLPYADREMAWRLIRQLNLNYLALEDLDHRPGGQALRDLLRLYVMDDDSEFQCQIEGLIGVKTCPMTRKLPGKGPMTFGRDIECMLTIDESGFSGTSPYLFGLILKHWLARHVSINSFTQTKLYSMQRGLIHTWPVRTGTRGTM